MRPADGLGRRAGALCCLVFWMVQDGPLKPGVVLVVDEKAAKMEAPSAAAVDEKTGEIYIADQEGNAIHIVDATGRAKAKLDIPSPVSIALDDKGKIYSASARGELCAYDFRGRKEGTLTPEGLPAGAKPPTVKQVAIDNGTIFIADSSNQVVLAVGADGKLIRAYGAVGEAKGPKFKSISAFWATKTRIYVIDGGTSTVTVFGRNSGEFLFTFGERGGGRGQLAVPVGIATGKNGMVYVLDSVRHCIAIYDEDGAWRGECSGEGKSPGWFYFPKSMTRDAKGRFIVCEAVLKRVQVLTIPDLPVEKDEKKGK